MSLVLASHSLILGMRKRTSSKEQRQRLAVHLVGEVQLVTGPHSNNSSNVNRSSGSNNNNKGSEEPTLLLIIKEPAVVTTVLAVYVTICGECDLF